jgi:chaperonin GroES
MTIQLPGLRILVEAIQDPRALKGIALPDVAMNRASRGTVRHVGTGIVKGGVVVRPAVDVGDVVVFSKFAGTKVTLNGVEHVLLDERDVLAKSVKENSND